jgi:hypothetical protein
VDTKCLVPIDNLALDPIAFSAMPGAATVDFQLARD